MVVYMDPRVFRLLSKVGLGFWGLQVQGSGSLAWGFQLILGA